MTQQTENQSAIPAHLAARFRHVQLPANLSPKCEGAESLCPQCGAPCAHTPQEMQGFAIDAAAEASAGLARDEEACRRADDATTIAMLTHQVAALRSTPPTPFIELENDGTFREWMRMLSDNSTNGKMRKEIVRSIRDLVKACADTQRSASVTTLYQAAAAGNYLSIEEGLPAPYEEVRILVDGVARIARLDHTKSYFQLATFLSSTKGQYGVSLDRVEGWQPLIAAVRTPAATSTTPDA